MMLPYGRNVQIRDLVTTWSGRVYLLAVFVIEFGIFRGATRLGAGAGDVAIAVALGVQAAAVVATACAYRFPGDHLLWALGRSIEASVVTAVGMVAFFIVLGNPDSTAIFAYLPTRVLLSLMATALTLTVVNAVVLFFRALSDDTGGDETPEEQVLDDDLDL